MPLIDCHVHLCPAPELAPAGARHPTAREVLDLVASAGVDRLVAFPTFALAPDNRGLGALAAEGSCVIPFAWINPHLGDEAAEEARDLIRASGFRGIKLHPLLHAFFPNRPVTDAIMRVAEEARVPVLVHSGHAPHSLPWQIAELAQAWPRVPVIMEHMGLQLGWVDDAIRLAERVPNLYLGTTAMPFHLKIREAVERIGSARVVWGSDAPGVHPQVELARLDAAGLSPADRDSVAGGSLLRLIGEG